MTTPTFEELMERVDAGERLSAADIGRLVETPDILPLGMLADALRRRLHGTQVTFVRVASCPFDQSFVDTVPPAAREVRITGTPQTLEIAVTAVESARAVAGGRAVSGFSWEDVERLAAADGSSISKVLEKLRAEGLEAVAEVPLDRTGGVTEAVDLLAGAGYQRLRLTVQRAPAAARAALLLEAAALQDERACIQAISPLPTVAAAHRPSTGYEDVRMVAIARLAAPNIPTVQVDWLRYGPKLAQVALTFGADDLDGVVPFDDSPDGRRRAPLEEVRRNIEAAGFTPAERDGRFTVVA
jgi:aminodeoxyfutalosine synthase